MSISTVVADISSSAKEKDVEVEFRFHLDDSYRIPSFIQENGTTHPRHEMKAIAAKLRSMASVVTTEKSINFIQGNRIRTNVYKGGSLEKKIFVEKRELHDPYYVTMENCVVKIGISRETPIEQFAVTKIDIARIKYRMSLIIPSLPDFRIDITLVREILTTPEMKTQPIDVIAFTKPLMFGETTPIANNTGKVSSSDAFMSSSAWTHATRVEIEAEFLKHGEFTEKHFEIIRFMQSVVEEIRGGDANDEYQAVKTKIIQLMYPKNHQYHFNPKNVGIKSIGNQVIELTRSELASHSMLSYMISPKTDGQRSLILLDNGRMHVLNETLTSFDVEFEGKAVLDVEEYKDLYYVFDVMFDQSSLMDQPYVKRIEHIANLIKVHEKLRMKPITPLVTPSDFLECLNGKYEFETDGCIFTPMNETYKEMRVYKYKPPSKLTIDFLIKRCPTNLLGVAPYRSIPGKQTYILFCGITPHVLALFKISPIRGYSQIFEQQMQHYMPIQFSPPNLPQAHIFWSDETNLDGQVGEFSWVGSQASVEDGHWRLVKIRSDRKKEVETNRYFGNNYAVAESIWNSIGKPLTPQEIVHAIQESPDNPIEEDTEYFKTHASELHKLSREFNNQVKFRLYRAFMNAHTLLDLGCGKGQDIFKFSKYGVKNLVCIDQSVEALTTLLERRKKLQRPMHIATLAQDLTRPADEIIEAITKAGILTEKATHVNCSLALHYFMSSKEACASIAKVISHYLMDNGIFMATFFDGRMVFDLLSENDGEWVVKKNDQILYSIKALYRDKKFGKFGQMVRVLLPVAPDPIDEALVDITEVSKVFAEHGLVRDTYKSFREYFEHLSVNATTEDRRYLSLYHVAVFRKK